MVYKCYECDERFSNYASCTQSYVGTVGILKIVFQAGWRSNTPMAELTQFIVTALNQEPFKKGLTLVAFDKKEGLELIQLLQDVIEEISPLQKVNLRDELPEDTAQRMFDFLWAIKYKPQGTDA